MKHLIIGMGSIGERHYRLLQEAGEEVTGVDIGGIIETDDIRKPFLNYDMVWICTPANIHYKYAEQAIFNGVKNIFIEKPVTQNLTQLEIIKNLSGKRVDGYQPKIWSACNYRFHPAVKVLKDNLAQVGKILYSRMHYSHYLPYQRENWREYMKDTNIVMDAGWHFVDLALWLFGRCDVWNNNSNSLELDCNDTAQFWLRHENYSSTYIWLDYLRRDKSWEIKVVGTEGTLELRSNWVTGYTSVQFLTEKNMCYEIFVGRNVHPDEMYYNQLNYLLKEDWQSNISETQGVMKICGG